MKMLKSGLLFLFLNILIGYFYHRSTFLVPKLTGGSDYSYRLVGRTYAKLIENGRDFGSSFAIYHNGKAVLDMIGGYSDYDFQLPWTSTTIAQSFSLAHIFSSIAIFHLKQKNLINLDQTVSSIIETCRLGETTVDDLLTHQAGLALMDTKIRLGQLNEDPDEFFMQICSNLLKLKDSSREPMLHYHSLPLLLDAIIRKLDSKKRPSSRLILEDIVWPNSLDINIGLPRTQVFRLARTYRPSFQGYPVAFLQMDWRYILNKIISTDVEEKATNWFSDLPIALNYNPELNEIPLASTHLYSNANNIAKFLSLTFFTEKILSSNSKDLIFNVTGSGFDPILKAHVAYSRGFMILKSPKNTDMIGWLDTTGQFAFADVHYNITFAYISNHLRYSSFGSDPVLKELISAIYAAL